MDFKTQMKMINRALVVVLLIGLGIWTYFGQSRTGNAQVAPVVGVQATVADFTVPAIDESGAAFDFTLSDYNDEWRMLFFYPADGTTVCPTELRELNAAREQFTDLGVRVIPVSMDSQESHQQWGPELADDFKYVWLSDLDGALSKQFGVYHDSVDLGRPVSLRGAFLIDPDGVLQLSVIHNENVGRNITELVRSTEAIQTGGLCGADWKPGDKTLDKEGDAVPLPETTEQ